MELVQEFVNDLEVEALNFQELMKEVMYAYENHYNILKRENGVFTVHKLAIGKNWAQYKESYYKMKPGVYEDFCKFFEMWSKE
jgi:hypothetical protein